MAAAQYHASLNDGRAITDAEGDRSNKAHKQIAPDRYVRIVERRCDGIAEPGAGRRRVIERHCLRRVALGRSAR